MTPSAVLTFTDVDGDKARILSSKGTSADLQQAAGFNGNGQLVLLDLSSATFGNEFEGANVSITLTSRAAGGDGLAAGERTPDWAPPGKS